jgi:hypothetical protein
MFVDWNKLPDMTKHSRILWGHVRSAPVAKENMRRKKVFFFNKEENIQKQLCVLEKHSTFVLTEEKK